LFITSRVFAKKEKDVGWKKYMCGPLNIEFHRRYSVA